jgi:hypothetical protein
MCAAICWMLQGWMPPVYALLGSLVAIGQIGTFSYWMDSYWGGAVAAAGGALALGALPRLARRASLAASTLGALGLVILANSRPYEGAVMAAAAVVALLWWRRRRRRTFRELLSWRNAVPLLLIGGCGLAFIGYYDYRVTGNPWKMPYMAYQDTYTAVPAIFVLPPKAHPPVIRDRVLRDFWLGVDRLEYFKLRHNPARALFLSLHDVMPFYCSMLIFFAMAGALLFTRSPRIWLAVGIGAVLWCGLLIETWHNTHYVAGGTGLVFVIAMYGVRLLKVNAGRMGPALVLLFAGTFFVRGVAAGVDAFRASSVSQPRHDVAQRILAEGGKHLAIVQYTPQHNVHTEWVFNAANIDAAPLVWARDLGEAKNRELLEYFHDRKAWLVHPDEPFSVTPYPVSQP